MTNFDKLNLYFGIFFYTVFILLSSNINAEIIDFETIPGVGIPPACLEISNQYQADYGITFSLEGGGNPKIAKEGSPREAYIGPGGGDDNLAAGQDVGDYFLTDDCLFGSITTPPLIVRYDPPTAGASGVIIDIDAHETFTIEARGISDNVLETIIISDGDAGTGDGIATPWSLRRILADVYSFRFIGIKSGSSFGLGFDNFSARIEPSILQFSVATYSVNENGGSATITVTRTDGGDGAVGVSYTTGNGTASAGSDYTAASGTLSWADGDTSNKTFSIPITDDILYEGNETVNLTLGSPTGGATLGSPNTAVLTIIDNEQPPVGTLQFSAATYSVNENGGSATITVTRTGGSNGVVGVSYATSNGTAEAGSDYTAASGTLSWADGDTSNKTFSVPIADDSVYEGNETVNLTLSSPTGGATLGSPNTAVLTIIDNEQPPVGTMQFSAATYSVNENGGTATITVTRTGGSNGVVGVSYATSNGTAEAGSDYTAASGTLSWANGDTSNKMFSVPITNDSVYEGNEAINLTLSSPTGGALGSPNTAVLTIVDMPVGILQFSAATYSVNENGGSATITVTRTGGSSRAVGVNYTTSNGTASAGSDYTAASGTLSWADGDTSNKTFSIPITDDSVYEGNETVNLTLSSPTGGATLGTPNTSVLTIIENEQPSVGTLQFSAAAYSVNKNGGSATITVTRTGGSYGAVGVSYTTSNGTARAGSDYITASGTLIWANGDTSDKTFSIPITDQKCYKVKETVNLTLSSPTGGTTLGSPNTAILIIIVNGKAPAGAVQFSAAAYSVNENGGSATITVTRAGGSNGVVSIYYGTKKGTARAGSDYTTTSGTLSWANGDTSDKTFSVPITDDSVYEGNESVKLTLKSPKGGAILGSQKTAVLTIIDNEQASAGSLVFSQDIVVPIEDVMKGEAGPFLTGWWGQDEYNQNVSRFLIVNPTPLFLTVEVGFFDSDSVLCGCDIFTISDNGFYQFDILHDEDDAGKPIDAPKNCENADRGQIKVIAYVATKVCNKKEKKLCPPIPAIVVGDAKIAGFQATSDWTADEFEASLFPLSSIMEMKAVTINKATRKDMQNMHKQCFTFNPVQNN